MPFSSFGLVFVRSYPLSLDGVTLFVYTNFSAATEFVAAFLFLDDIKIKVLRL